MKKLTDETVAKKLNAVALARFTKAHKTWIGDIEMLKMHANDYLDLIKIANLIGFGEIIKAHRKMCELDTEVRDCIPQYIWNYCDKI